LLLLKYLATQQVRRSEDLFVSYKIASELRRSSGDLSKMARLYVITGEKRYRDYFNEILTIRKGSSPRPVDYNEVYWDLVAGGEAPHPYEKSRSLVSVMIAHGLTLGEFELLRLAEERSNALGLIEVKAMNLRDGKYDDGSGRYSIKGKPNLSLAMELVFGDEYMKKKAEIMRPLQQFFSAVHQRTQEDYQHISRWMLYDIVFAIILALLSTIIMIISVMKALNTLSQATKENEMLLLNILPASIAERLKQGEELIADEFQQASVMFADIVGFTDMTTRLGVKKIVPLLNSLFEVFDNLTECFDVEKVKTIGDNYMAVAGVPTPSVDHAQKLADYAIAILETLQEFNIQNKTQVQMRIGMTYGPVVAGIIGHKKFIYDIWGDVVNTASRMESTSLPNRIQITEKMAFMLEDSFIVEAREPIEVKGIGTLKNYFLLGRKNLLIVENKA
jgi:class 3 adenylate cyclase